jgi:hypothetical protein
MSRNYHEHWSELDHMIQDRANEHNVPYPIFPATAREGAPCARGEEDNQRRALEWREKLIVELEERPEWVAEWRAAQELDDAIEALCKARGLQFHPHETTPWQAPDELPAGYDDDADSWHKRFRDDLPQAVKLRRRLIAELEGRR